MSRVGRVPVPIPAGVTVSAKDRVVTVKGPKGELKYKHRPEVDVAIDGAAIKVTNNRSPYEKAARAYHGMTRALLQNMVHGVAQGYERKLEITGVGYTVKLEGKNLVLTLGYANPVKVPVPPTVQVDVPNQTSLVVRGADLQQVGLFTAQVRKLKPPEPYKGKGFRYENEVIRRKAGKAFGSA
ncbi:MAG: 50S ribosomal protein L6 [Planctomycetota bacterium]